MLADYNYMCVVIVCRVINFLRRVAVYGRIGIFDILHLKSRETLKKKRFIYINIICCYQVYRNSNLSRAMGIYKLNSRDDSSVVTLISLLLL